jgi:hypothetical protein
MLTSLSTGILIHEVRTDTGSYFLLECREDIFFFFNLSAFSSGPKYFSELFTINYV